MLEGGFYTQFCLQSLGPKRLAKTGLRPPFQNIGQAATILTLKSCSEKINLNHSYKLPKNTPVITKQGWPNGAVLVLPQDLEVVRSNCHIYITIKITGILSSSLPDTLPCVLPSSVLPLRMPTIHKEPNSFKHQTAITTFTLRFVLNAFLCRRLKRLIIFLKTTTVCKCNAGSRGTSGR